MGQHQNLRGRVGVARRILAVFDSGADEMIRQAVTQLRAKGADNEEIVLAIDSLLNWVPAFSCDEPPAHSVCRRCHKGLVTGPGTGQRSSRVFCSDRCRKAYARANQAKVAA